jgi:hypothetical protein
MARKRFVEGVALLDALRHTASPIKWMRRPDDPAPVVISPEMAIPIVRAGNFKGTLNKGRVILVCEQAAPPQPVADLHFWDGRGVRHFFTEQRSKPGEYFRSFRDGRLLWGRAQDFPDDHPDNAAAYYARCQEKIRQAWSRENKQLEEQTHG